LAAVEATLERGLIWNPPRFENLTGLYEVWVECPLCGFAGCGYPKVVMDMIVTVEDLSEVKLPVSGSSPSTNRARRRSRRSGVASSLRRSGEARGRQDAREASQAE
jgi:hypothetical protein